MFHSETNNAVRAHSLRESAVMMFSVQVKIKENSKR